MFEIFPDHQVPRLHDGAYKVWRLDEASIL